MKVEQTDIPDVVLIKPTVFEDDRGFFYEVWNERTFDEHGLEGFRFVQDNHSASVRGTLRGLHYQIEQPQGKLVRCTVGSVYDVAVDLRRSSPTFGQWVGEELSAENKRMLWIPPGFAHGFLVTSAKAEFQYKCTDFYAPEHERTLDWRDETISVDWPIEETAELIVSDKDQQGASWEACDKYE
jgi:dTDP-4-dehydrorhamnose 3,5-epimerase